MVQIQRCKILVHGWIHQVICQTQTSLKPNESLEAAGMLEPTPAKLQDWITCVSGLLHKRMHLNRQHLRENPSSCVPKLGDIVISMSIL